MTAPTSVQYSFADTPIGGGRYTYKPAPFVTASKVHAINLRTRRVYYNKYLVNSEMRPASMTKLLTAALLIDKKATTEALSQQVTIISSDLKSGSGANLLVGDVITLHALLRNALMPSSNTSAQTIARVIGQEMLDTESGGVGNPITRFVQEMNSFAESIGATDSNFLDPHGLSESSVSVPHDINLIAERAFSSSVIREIWTHKTYDIPVTRDSEAITIAVTNTNSMFYDTGIVGGKTGTLGGTANLNVIYHAPNGDYVAATVIGSTTDSNRYVDMRAIIAALPVDYPALAG